MYRRILVPLEHSPADEAILTHVRALAMPVSKSKPPIVSRFA